MEAPVTFYDPNNDTRYAFSQEAAGICIWLVTLRTCEMVALERGHFVEMGVVCGKVQGTTLREFITFHVTK